MAYTAAQQAKLDAAQKQINLTKPVYDGLSSAYNNYVSQITCYGTFPTVDQIKTGALTPDRNTCTSAGSCTHSDKVNCQNNVDYVNQNYVPQLQAAWSNYNAALTNYNTVLAQVTAEAAPQTAADVAAAAAAASASGKTTTDKWLFFGLVALIIIGAAVYMIFKMPQVRKLYVIGGATGLVIVAYLIFFGFKKPA